MDSTGWRDRLSEEIRHANDLAQGVLTAYFEASIAADFYEESLCIKAKRRKQKAVGQYGERFISWMYQLEDGATDLNSVLSEVGDQFANAAKGVVERGRLSACSAHHLVFEVAFGVAARVSGSITRHLVEGWPPPGVEMVVPRLFQKEDFARALPVAVKAFHDWQTQVAFLDQDANAMSALLDQDLAGIEVGDGETMTKAKAAQKFEVTTRTIRRWLDKPETRPDSIRIEEVSHTHVKVYPGK